MGKLREHGQGGEALRFEAFYAEHHGAVVAYVRRRLGDRDASDVVAQVFSVAWRRLDAVRSPPEDRLWLYGVARRMVADHRRSSLRCTRLAQRLSVQPPEPLAGGFEAIESRVQAVMAGLRPGDQEVLRLVIWPDWVLAPALDILPPTARRAVCSVPLRSANEQRASMLSPTNYKSPRPDDRGVLGDSKADVFGRGVGHGGGAHGGARAGPGAPGPARYKPVNRLRHGPRTGPPR